MKKAACKGSAKKKKNLTYDITVRGQDINVRGLNEIVLGLLWCDPSQLEKRSKHGFRGTSSGRKPLERVDCVRSDA